MEVRILTFKTERERRLKQYCALAKLMKSGQVEFISGAHLRKKKKKKKPKRFRRRIHKTQKFSNKKVKSLQ